MLRDWGSIGVKPVQLAEAPMTNPGKAAIATEFLTLCATGRVRVVHILRFEGDRIVELWDIGQEIPQDSPNEHGMF